MNIGWWKEKLEEKMIHFIELYLSDASNDQSMLSNSLVWKHWIFLPP